MSRLSWRLATVTEPDELTRLMNWYVAHFNEDWEHLYGVTIDTLDNPGWSLTVDLEETPPAGKAFDPILTTFPKRCWTGFGR